MYSWFHDVFLKRQCVWDQYCGQVNTERQDRHWRENVAAGFIENIQNHVDNPLPLHCHPKKITWRELVPKFIENLKSGIERTVCLLESSCYLWEVRYALVPLSTGLNLVKCRSFVSAFLQGQAWGPVTWGGSVLPHWENIKILPWLHTCMMNRKE